MSAWSPETCDLSSPVRLHVLVGLDEAQTCKHLKLSRLGVAHCKPHTQQSSEHLQGRFEEALEDYSAAIKLNPRHCRAFYNRAFSNDRLRRYDAAVADYTRALEIQPGNGTAFHNRASLFERLGRYTQSPLICKFCIAAYAISLRLAQWGALVTECRAR